MHRSVGTLAGLLLLLGSGCGIDHRILNLRSADGGLDGGALVGCTLSNTTRAADNGFITDFLGEEGFWEFAPSGNTVMYAASDGALHLSTNEAAGPDRGYAGVVLAFSECIDASAFSGVQFTISGSVSGCNMQYATEFTEDDSSQPLGSCSQATSCYSPEHAVTPMSIATTVRFPWESATFYAPGKPVPSPNDPMKLIGTVWQFTIPTVSDGGSDTCIADVTITNLTFYH